MRVVTTFIYALVRLLGAAAFIILFLVGGFFFWLFFGWMQPDDRE